MRRAAAVIAVGALLAGWLQPTAAADAAAREPALSEFFGGLGAWVSIFEATAWERPERTVADLSHRGVGTLYLQSASSRPGPAVFRPDRTERFLHAAHKRGMSVVAWYLPPYIWPGYELRRAMGAIGFRTARGDAFDGFALDIETAPGSPAVAMRNRRLVRLSEQLRRMVGDGYPLGAIIPSPQALDQPFGRRWWPNFPYRDLHRLYDAFLPMGYYTYHGDGARSAFRDTRLNLEILRRETGDPAVAIHVIGGLGRASDYAEGRAFRRALDQYGASGASMWSYSGMGPEDWQALAGYVPGSRGR